MSVIDKIDRNINIAVLTVSDTRNKETDKGGQLVLSYLNGMNVSVKEEHYKIVRDDASFIREAIQTWLSQDLSLIHISEPTRP